MHCLQLFPALAILLVSLQSCVSARVAEAQRARIGELEETVAAYEEDWERNQAEINMIVRDYEAEMDALEQQNNETFDREINRIIIQGNTNVESLHERAIKMLKKNDRDLTALAGTLLSIHFSPFVGRELRIETDSYSTRLVIDLEQIYDESTLEINESGRGILGKLNASLLAQLERSGSIVELTNISTFIRDGKEFVYPTPSPFLKEFAAAIDSFSYYDGTEGLDDNPRVPVDEPLEYLRDEFVLIFRRPFPQLYKELINEYADGGQLIWMDAGSEVAEMVGSTRSSSLGNDLMPISLVSEPERSQKFLMLPSAYRVAGLYKSSVTDDMVVKAVQRLEEKNKIIKFFDGTRPEAIRCGRHYAIVILREGEVIYKSDRVKIPCSDVKTFE